MLFKFIICFIAGIGAGLGTGFAGMSAAAVISPMLITFLGVPAYEAVGIALASDVLASAVSAYTYGKNKNLDIKNGLVMMAAVLCFTLVGSWISSLIPSTAMGGFSVFMTLLLGIKFIVKPVMTTKESMTGTSPGKRFVQSVVCGMAIGFICGFVGAGGGMMMSWPLRHLPARSAILPSADRRMSGALFSAFYPPCSGPESRPSSPTGPAPLCSTGPPVWCFPFLGFPSSL